MGKDAEKLFNQNEKLARSGNENIKKKFWTSLKCA